MLKFLAALCRAYRLMAAPLVTPVVIDDLRAELTLTTLHELSGEMPPTIWRQPLHYKQHFPEHMLLFGPTPDHCMWSYESMFGNLKGLLKSRKHPVSNVLNAWGVGFALRTVTSLLHHTKHMRVHHNPPDFTPNNRSRMDKEFTLGGRSKVAQKLDATKCRLDSKACVVPGAADVCRDGSFAWRRQRPPSVPCRVPVPTYATLFACSLANFVTPTHHVHMNAAKQRNTHSFTDLQLKEHVSIPKPTRTETLFVCLACCYSASIALGGFPTLDNKYMWATDNTLTVEQEKVLALLQEETFIVDEYLTVTIGREHFHTATLNEASGKFTSTMGSSHLKANVVQCLIRAADTSKEETLMSQYSLLTDILQLDGSKKTILLNVRWYKHESAKKHPVTKNVHVFLDAPFEDTMECMIEPCMIETMVVFLDLPPRPLDEPPMLRPKAAVLDRRFSGSICMAVLE
jgi:hypothetical protein